MASLTVTFVVSSDSAESLRLARQAVTGKVRPDSVLSDVGTAHDRIKIEHYRISDYFESVQIADADPTSFRIVFALCHDADRYWKDLVVKILVSLKGAGVSICSEKRLA